MCELLDHVLLEVVVEVIPELVSAECTKHFTQVSGRFDTPSDSSLELGVHCDEKHLDIVNIDLSAP